MRAAASFPGSTPQLFFAQFRTASDKAGVEARNKAMRAVESNGEKLNHLTFSTCAVLVVGLY